jgi:hypothetical protein
MDNEIEDPNNWGALLHALRFVDKSPENFCDLEAVLLKIAAKLAKAPPLVGQFRQRQVLEEMRERHIQGASALLRAARAQYRKAAPTSGVGEGAQAP